MIPIGLSIAKDPECRVIISNPHHATLLGRRPDENTSIDPRAHDPASFRIFRNGIEIGADELPRCAGWAREGTLKHASEPWLSAKTLS
jgi:hypothetical protein